MSEIDIGQIVVLTEVDSDPRLLVTAADDDTEDVTGVLLADLADDTIQRLEPSVGDRQHCQQLTTAVRRTDDLMTFRVPVDELRLWGHRPMNSPYRLRVGDEAR